MRARGVTNDEETPSIKRTTLGAYASTTSGGILGEEVSASMKSNALLVSASPTRAI